MFSLIEIVKFISFYKIKQKRMRHHCKIHLYFLVGFAVEEYVIVRWLSFLSFLGEKQEQTLLTLKLIVCLQSVGKSSSI